MSIHQGGYPADTAICYNHRRKGGPLLTYYQILRSRRTSFHLSVQEAADQTRLKPEYIRAIENNTLDIFSDDFSYVRYFIHAYCDALGVNWEMVVDEVDANIAGFANARDQALSSARARMIQSMPVQKQNHKQTRRQSRRRKKGFLQASAGRVSRILNWDSKNKLAKTAIVSSVCLVAALAVLTFTAEAASRKAAQQSQQAREQELLEREQRTQQMALELQQQKGEVVEQEQQPVKPVVESYGQQPNEFSVTFTAEGADQSSMLNSQSVSLLFETYTSCDVLVYLEDSPVFNQMVDGTAQYTLQASNGSTLYIYYGSPVPRDLLYVNDVQVPVDMNELASDSEAGVILHISVQQKAVNQDAAQDGAASDSAGAQSTDYSSSETDYDSGYDAGYDSGYDG